MVKKKMSEIIKFNSKISIQTNSECHDTASMSYKMFIFSVKKKMPNNLKVTILLHYDADNTKR